MATRRRGGVAALAMPGFLRVGGTETRAVLPLLLLLPLLVRTIALKVATALKPVATVRAAGGTANLSTPISATPTCTKVTALELVAVAIRSASTTTSQQVALVLVVTTTAQAVATACHQRSAFGRTLPLTTGWLDRLRTS